METFVGKVAEHSKVFSSLTTFEFLIYDLRAFLHKRRGNRAAAKRELEVLVPCIPGRTTAAAAVARPLSGSLWLSLSLSHSLSGLRCHKQSLGPLAFNSPNIAQRHALHVEKTALVCLRSFRSFRF